MPRFFGERMHCTAAVGPGAKRREQISSSFLPILALLVLLAYLSVPGQLYTIEKLSSRRRGSEGRDGGRRRACWVVFGLNFAVCAGVRVIAIKPDQFRILLGAWSTSKGERACERMGPTAYGSRENQRGAGPLRFVPGRWAYT